MNFVRYAVLFATSMVLFTGSARAEHVQPILTVTSDAFSGQGVLSIVTDDDLVATGVRYQSATADRTFPIGDLASGMVLLVQSGRDIVMLKSQDFDPRSGGSLTLRYLYSGLNGSYRSAPVEIERTGDDWQLWINDSGGRRVATSAYFKANRLLGSVVGISSVTFRSSRFAD